MLVDHDPADWRGCAHCREAFEAHGGAPDHEPCEACTDLTFRAVDVYYWTHTWSGRAATILMMLAVEKYPEADPLNIGTSEEIKIKDLVQLIVRLSGKNLQIVFDTSKPAGAARRCPDISKAKRLIGYQPEVRMEEGLQKTIDWYLDRYLEPAAVV